MVDLRGNIIGRNQQIVIITIIIITFIIIILIIIIIIIIIILIITLLSAVSDKHPVTAGQKKHPNVSWEPCKVLTQVSRIVSKFLLFQIRLISVGIGRQFNSGSYFFNPLHELPRETIKSSD